MPPYPKPTTGRAKARFTYLRRLDICATICGSDPEDLAVNTAFKAEDFGVSVSTIRSIHEGHCLTKGSLDYPSWSKIV